MRDSDDRVDPEELDVARSHLDFPVVGIGASAGGIGALQKLFGGMPRESGMAFVVVMHLSPDHDSSLPAIIERAAGLPTMAATESTPIEANHVYVISPSKKLAMTDGHLRVTDLTTVEGRRRSIDLFFRSLAQAHRERAVGIVLSGTGADGSEGLKRLKELGGVTLVQSPVDAEFDGMPRAAVRTGLVDFVMPISEMPAKLVELWENARHIELPSPPPDMKVEHVSSDAKLLAEEALLSIKALLRERTGHDFAHYKRATVLRRLERRMQVAAMPDLPSYRRLLETDPLETRALLQDMLISVTNFFRDPEAFNALEAMLKSAIAERPATVPFRAWIAGCATGEEAYSVAILLRELLEPSGTPLQVFASDIDQRAVAAARTGQYHASIATDVSPERLRERFVADGVDFQISKGVRDAVVFSVHNALSDPPFTRMDLICCRNLLIYLDRSAQAQLLRSFHFALKPRGLLFLGSSETVDPGDGLFIAEDKRHRIYRASDTVKRPRVLPNVPSLMASLSLASMAEPASRPAARPPLEALHLRVLLGHAPPTVLVDADDTALHVDERVAHLLRMPGGAPSNKLLALARPELRMELRAALVRAAETGRSVQARRVKLQVNGRPRVVTMSVRPALSESPPGLLLVVFDDSEETMDEATVPDKDPVLFSLEAELLRTQDQLRSLAGESAASTEELRASNEELQTINEELRSTTEELETSKEELQAVNEELMTVNGELQLKIEETGKVNDDLQNLMVTAEIGSVFVDREMRIKRFTPQAATLFNLLASDAGRPLLDITHRLDYPQLADDAAQVLRDLRRIEREVRSADGRWFLARVLPYRTGEDRIDGVVFAFFDVSSRRAMEERLRLSEQRMRLVAESMRDYAIITTDQDGVIATWSPGAERVFGHSGDEAVGVRFDLLFTEEDRLAGVPAQELSRATEFGRAEDDRWHVHKDGQRIYCSGITSPLTDGGIVGFAKIARDLTDAQLRNKRQEAALSEERATSETMRQANAMKDEFLAVVSHELKNPLAVIQMNAHLLARLPAFAAEPRAARATGAIGSAVSSQVQIINDLLDLSQVNMGKVALGLAPLDLAALVRNIVDAIDADVAAKQQSLTREIPASLPVVGDAVRVEQIVWNLLTNAVKFTPPGGAVELRLALDGEMAKLTVSDSGIGIDPGNLTNIFDMFRQLDTGASRKKPGLGIGLALVKQLAELHGGRVEARSEGLEKGASFSVWLPVAGEPSANATGAAANGGFGGLRILVVDDEPELLTAFGDLLRGEGARVVSSEGATRALELARTEPFDVVVSDVAMPEHDGHWLAAQLRGADETRDLPMVAVSGRSRGADRQKAIESGFDAYVGKPLDLDELRRAVSAAMARRLRPEEP